MCHFWVGLYCWKRFCITHNQIFKGKSMWLHPQLWWLCYIRFLHLPTDKWTFVLAGILELLLAPLNYIYVYISWCVLSKTSASENELYLTLYSMCIAIMFQYSYCVYWVIIYFLIQFANMLSIHAAFSSCGWVLNFFHCERPKTTDSLACMHLR